MYAVYVTLKGILPPFKPNRLIYPNHLDKPISNFKGHWVVFFHFSPKILAEHSVSKQ